jgi:hypothetical protein
MPFLIILSYFIKAIINYLKLFYRWLFQLKLLYANYFTLDHYILFHVVLSYYTLR